MRKMIILLMMLLMPFGSVAHAALIDNGNGTVTDGRTGLIWQQGEPGTKAWGSALSYCERLNLGGSTSWRLPNFKELVSLTEDRTFQPAIDTTRFPNAHSSWYWSSTTYAYFRHTAWVVDFTHGRATGGTPKDSGQYVRCVRGGYSREFGNLVTIKAEEPAAAEKPLAAGRFLVTLALPTTAPLTVYYTVSGTAAADGDYQALPGSVTIATGQTRARIVVSPVDDAVDEARETVIVTLDADTAYEVESPSAATVTISDNDPAPTVQFSLARSSGLEATTPATIDVSLSAASERTVKVHYATARRTAVARRDYRATSGTLTFSPGETSRSIGVSVKDDTVEEPDETFAVKLSAPVHATLGGIRRHIRIITNDDF